MTGAEVNGVKVSNQTSKIPIGIVFETIDKVAKNALTYLILYQNGIQNTFEFRILSALESDPFSSRLQQGISRVDATNECGEYVRRVLNHNRKSAERFNLNFDEIREIVIITDSQFTDNFYLVGSENWTILAFGGWKNQFSPPSIVEYYLTHVVTAALDALSPNNNRHHDTRACIFDFNTSLSSTRYKVLTGKLCDACAKRLENEFTKSAVDDVNILLNRSWLGTTIMPSDVAMTVKKLGYDLFHTAGPTPNAWEKLRAIMAEEMAKKIVGAIVSGVVAGLVILLGLGSLAASLRSGLALP